LFCIHGLDDSNCPVCRASRLSVPENPINQIDRTPDLLKPENPSFKRHIMNKKEFEQEVAKKFTKPLQADLITSIPKPNLINELTLIDTNPLLDRINLLDINHLDPNGISKRVPVKKAELDLNKEI
jgi:hypothetical protein